MPTQSNITGNAATATKLKTARKINGTDFDGTQDINVNAANDSDIVHKSGDETITGAKTFDGKFLRELIQILLMVCNMYMELLLN